MIDLVYTLDELPGCDGKFPVSSYRETNGGMAANAAVIVNRLGGRGLWCGLVGDDDKGRRILAGLAAEGVDITHARTIPGVVSAHSIVLEVGSGERAVLFYRPSALPLASGWLPLEALLSADVVLADNRWVEGAPTLVCAARARGIPAVVDIDAGGDGRSADIAAAASHAIYSRTGLAAVTGTDDPTEGLASAARRTPFAAVTLGADGVLWQRAGEPIRHRPAFAVASRETVGAGDVFHGAFALALAEGMDDAAAIAFASATAALKCAGIGGRESFPNRAAVEACLASGQAVNLHQVAARDAAR